MKAPRQQIITALGGIVGADNVLTADEDRRHWGTDWTRFYAPNPMGIVFPRTVEAVAQLVHYAKNNHLPLVPSGGRTGLSGGAVAMHQEVVVSFDKLNKIKSFNEIDQTLVVEAGVVTARLQEFAQQKSLYYPVDFASSGSSQIGGNIATNAGGIKVLRYGLTREQVVGLKVVTGSGEILELNQGLIKNATGYDLRHVFIGSEGTLGFIVEATIKLTAPPPPLVVALLAVPDMAHTINLLTTFRRHVTLSAFEFFSDLALTHVAAHSSLSLPFAQRANFYVLLEFEHRTEADMAAAEVAFVACTEAGWVTDGLLSQTEQQRLTFWQYREGISEAITPLTPYKHDLSVLPSGVPAFLAAVDALVAKEYPDFESLWFGHIGDGNLHLNILKPDTWAVDEFREACEGVNDKMLQLVQAHKGSISAEHGIGLLKKSGLHYTRPEGEIALMRALKAVFDPEGIMNPGKLF